MELLIISGLSGAGKSRAAAVLEDFDYYCVDNLPVELMPKFAELCLTAKDRYEKVALVTDVRAQDTFENLFDVLEELKTMGCHYSILYMTASDQTIINRYKESRRPHPLEQDEGSLEAAVENEKKILKDVRARADYIIDTTDMTLGQLQHKISNIVLHSAGQRQMRVNILSFGYKYGIPIESDLVIDVRFLPNPYYEADLRELTGLDEKVCEYVFKDNDSKEFMAHLTTLFQFLIPKYTEEGKMVLTISIGCTGGRHRSVAVAEKLGEVFDENGYAAHLRHRDIKR